MSCNDSDGDFKLAMMSSNNELQLFPVAAPRKLVRPEGFAVAATGVTLDGEAIHLLVSHGSNELLTGRITQPGWASFPKTHTDVAYSSIFVISDSSGSRQIELRGLTATFPLIDLLPQDRILVVASRCFRHQDGTHELNASIFGPDGSERQKFLLGDGLSHVQVDKEENIWVGYHDEGVFGNFGWQQPGGPFGRAGLSCFTPSGQKTWDFSPPDGFDYIADCYALNVAQSGAWAYYYSDFPVALIDSDRNVRCWSTESAGAKTFAVGDGKVLLYGGYGEQRNECTLLHLADTDAPLIAKVSLCLPAGVDPLRTKVIGRNNQLHLFFEDDWFVFSVDSLG